MIKASLFTRAILASCLITGCAATQKNSEPPAPASTQAQESFVPNFKSCPQAPERQKLRSDELQLIVQADQKDRQAENIDWNRVTQADEARAKRVAEIFAEGCFSQAKDYAAAALVFQHGVTPDHYYQAYLWAKTAIAMGDGKQKLLMTNAIDRYLINKGYKQLFAGQSFRYDKSPCRCLDETALEFPDQKRIALAGQSLQSLISTLQERNKAYPECKDVIYCNQGLQTPPHGLFPEIW